MKIHIKSVMYITIDNFMSVQIATMLHKFVTRDFCETSLWCNAHLK